MHRRFESAKAQAAANRFAMCILFFVVVVLTLFSEVYTEDQKAFRIHGNAPINVFGICANILNVIIFADRDMRPLLVNHFLLALSISG